MEDGLGEKITKEEMTKFEMLSICLVKRTQKNVCTESSQLNTVHVCGIQSMRYRKSLLSNTVHVGVESVD